MSGGHNFRLANSPKNEVLPLFRPKYLGVSPVGIRDFKPKIKVRVGDVVKKGQELFYDKNYPKIKFVSPSSGKIFDIKFGQRRSLQAVVIKSSFEKEDLSFDIQNQDKSLSKTKIKDILLKSGLWVSFKSFPGFSIIPEDQDIKSFYLSMFATEPHLPNQDIVLSDNIKYFEKGICILRKISSDFKVFLTEGQEVNELEGVSYYRINNKYPAENIGVQSYYTDNISKGEVVASLSLDSLINVGYLFSTGKLRTEKIYTVSGDNFPKNAHYKGVSCMSISDITGIKHSVAKNQDMRFIAGGLFTGNKLSIDDYVSPFDSALQVLTEDRVRTPFAFLRFGFNTLSLSRTFGSVFNHKHYYQATTSQNGEERACIQCGYCSDFCPIKLLPNMIMKASLAKDIEKMEELFIHDCAECGLCSFVCPSKIELLQIVKDGKNLIKKEG